MQKIREALPAETLGSTKQSRGLSLIITMRQFLTTMSVMNACSCQDRPLPLTSLCTLHCTVHGRKPWDYNAFAFGCPLILLILCYKLVQIKISYKTQVN